VALKLWPTESDLPTHLRPVPCRGAVAERQVIDACKLVVVGRMMGPDDNQCQDHRR
jgi:hypothetical protein